MMCLPIPDHPDVAELRKKSSFVFRKDPRFHEDWEQTTYHPEGSAQEPAHPPIAET